MSTERSSNESPPSSDRVDANSAARREMPTGVKLVGFGLGLFAVFGAALSVGAWVGPVGEPAAADQMADHTAGQIADHGSDHDASSGTGDDLAGHGPSQGSEASGSNVPSGLQVSEGGYTFVPTRTVFEAGNREFEFVIEGPDGSSVTDYEIEHEKELHLIAVRRDFTGFQHVHPERASDGTWATRVDLTGGTWRLFADFTPTPDEGADVEALTLGIDVTVTGPTGRIAAAGSETRRVDTVDGYQVELIGSLTPGEESDLSFAVTRKGDPVADLQPYLGARGHLVALREGDLAYLHVHPTDSEDATGHKVGFAATVPSIGGYRLYLDFRVDGVVRTASFILPADSGGASESSGSSEDGADGDGGDETHGEDDHTH
jgi:hypothetical protein